MVKVEDRLDALDAEMKAREVEKAKKIGETINRARLLRSQGAGSAQAVKDEAYKKRLQSHYKADEVRLEEAKKRQQEFEKRNRLEKQKHEKNYERVLKEAEVIYESPRLTKTLSGSYTTYPAWMTEGSIKHFETHKSMSEIRQTNLQLIRRAHKYQLEQALDKIQDIRVRVKALNASKSEAQLRRQDMIKNCAIEKHHLTFQVEKVRDAPPERMNSLLEQMGMPPIKTGKEKDEEDEQQK